MLNLKHHPFAVEAFFENSNVITLAAPKKALEELIPSSLELDTYENYWGFIAAAFVQTRYLRPHGFPKFLGRDFVLAGFRVFVRYKEMRGKRLRGLYIMKSFTDKGTMARLGNMFTHYNYQKCNFTLRKEADHYEIKSASPSLHAVLDYSQEELPHGSPFSSWKDARRFAGPMPFTFSESSSSRSIIIIEGIRQKWNPKPVSIVQFQSSFIDRLAIDDLCLASAFSISNISYQWKKGRVQSIAS